MGKLSEKKKATVIRLRTRNLTMTEKFKNYTQLWVFIDQLHQYIVL